MTGYMPAGWAKTSAVRWGHRWRAVRRSCTWIGTPGSTRTAHCRMMTSTCSWSTCTRWNRRESAWERRASPPSGRNTSTSRGMSTATAEPLCVWDSSRPFPECLTTLSPTAWAPPSAPRYGRRSARESRALRRTLRGRTPWWIMPEAKACSAKYSTPRWKRLPMNPTISLH